MKILLVDDDNISRDTMTVFLRDLLGNDVVQINNANQALEIFNNEDFQLIISDIKMPDKNGIEFLKDIKKTEKGNCIRFVLMTGYAEVDTAVQAIREGAYDYLLKPIDVKLLDDLITRVNNILEIESQFSEQINESEPSLQKSDRRLSKILNNSGNILNINGDEIAVFSNKIRDLIQIAIKLNEDRSVPVLIDGESGTGKEVFMKIVHNGLEGTDLPLVTLNCSAISPNLFESELFGYEGGTFTGSRSKGMSGKLELSQGGTLFLDEIGDMPLDMQPKLLRVLQERYFYRVGGLKKIQLNTRIIAATNKNLFLLIDNGQFRLDLYHRLNIGMLHLIPLREQIEAILPLANQFLLKFAAQKNKKFRLISKGASKLLENYPWFGNIRELRNAIERVVLLNDDIELKPEHLSFLDVDYKNFSENKFVLTPDSFELPDSNFSLDEIEIAIIKKALQKFNNNQTKTSEYLGISRGTLRNKLNL